MILRQGFLSLLLVAALPFFALADDNNNNYNNYNNYNNNNNYNQYQAQQQDGEYENKNYVEQYKYDLEQVDDNIQYWSSFHIRARRCVVYNNVDIIVFDMFGAGDQCMDQLVGTYYTPVPFYMQGKLDEQAQKMEDRGYDDYVAPEVAQYQYCTPKEVNGVVYYLQLGCADDTTQSIAVNVYKDNTCETRASDSSGFDDANIDISEVQVEFKKCQACVNWVNPADDQIDDGYYEKRQMMAPLCSTAWEYKEECGKRCQRAGLKDEREGWKSSDITLLIVLSFFGAVMGILIYRRRQNMPHKDALLEQAAMNAAGLQQMHVIAVACLFLLVVCTFAALGLKNVTLALILIADIVLFGYLMKLTFDYSMAANEEVGPDGQILQKADSDDSEDAASRESNLRSNNNGTYMLPTLT